MRAIIVLIFGASTYMAAAQTAQGETWRSLLGPASVQMVSLSGPHFEPPPLGIFCRLDLLAERHLPLPLHLRLGDPLLVDRMEGKGPLSYDTRERGPDMR